MLLIHDYIPFVHPNDCGYTDIIRTCIDFEMMLKVKVKCVKATRFYIHYVPNC